MKVVLEIPEYDASKGFQFNWEYGFELEIKYDKSIIITANKEGLISLANHLLNLAQDNVPSNYHLHLDDYGGLNEGSTEIIIQKV